MTPPSPTSSPVTPERARPRAGPRVPWALVPVVIAGLYAAGHALLSSRPSLEEMIPADAILTWRYADLSAYDEAHPPATGSTEVRARDELGAQLNLPGLPGIAPDRSLVEAVLDPTRRVDPRFFVLPVADATAVRKTFLDPDLEERHARRVVVHGAWAAAAWDARAALDAGRAGGDGPGVLPPLPPWAQRSVTADWPRLVDAALLPWVGRHSPYAEALAALGFRPPSRPAGAGAEGLPKDTVAVAEAGRVPLVRDAWSRVTLVSGPGRVEVRLVPSPASQLTPLLRSLHARPRAAAGRSGSPAPSPPPGAAGHVCVPDGLARRVIVYTLGYAGVHFAAAAEADDFAALRLPADAAAASAGEGWTLAALPAPGLEPTLTFAWAGPTGADGGYAGPDLTAFGLPPVPALDAVVPLAADALPLRAPFGGTAGTGEVARVRTPTTVSPVIEVVACGGGAGAHAATWATSARWEAYTPPTDDDPSLAVVAYGRLERFTAQRLLRHALAPGGLFAALADGDLEVTVFTDGETLLVRCTR